MKEKLSNVKTNTFSFLVVRLLRPPAALLAEK